MCFSVRHGLQNASFRRMRFSSPGQTSSRLTENRILRRRPHGKPHSASTASRKSAFCADGLTQKRTLPQRSHGKPHSGGSEDPRVHLSVRASYRMRFSVRHGLQNASFRRVRFSSPGQTSSSLTQKRTLPRRLHGKPHSAQMASRKSAFCPGDLTQKRILRRWPHGKPHSAPTPSRKSAFCADALTENCILAVLKTPECAFFVRTPHRTECGFRSVLHFAMS